MALKFNPTSSPRTKVLLFARLVSPLNDGAGPKGALLGATGGVLLFGGVVGGVVVAGVVVVVVVVGVVVVVVGGVVAEPGVATAVEGAAAA